MIKELYQEIICETTLNVTQSKIDSVRNKNIKKSGCRIYKDGFIGIQGILGEPTEETWKQAEKNLELKIPYEYEPEKNKKRSRDIRNTKITQKEFIEKSEKILEKLREEYPMLIFSNKITLNETTEILKNDCELEYVSSNNCVGFGLLFKHVESANIFDSFISYISKDYDVEKILDEAREQLNAFNNKVELPDGEKVVMITSEFKGISSKIIESLNAKSLGTETSMFNSKMSQKIFNDNFTLFVDRSSETYETMFFDKEGSTLEGDKFNLIENGKLLTGYSDKKNSKRYNFENTAAADSGYDGVPCIGVPNLSIKSSEKTLKELVGDEKAIFIIMMSGGDSTNEGVFSSPVQMAYLYEKGKMVGRLPEFFISASIYDSFGQDYIGYTKDRPYFGQKVLVTKVNVSK